MSWLIASLFLVVILELLGSLSAKGFLQRLLSVISIAFIALNSVLILIQRPSVWALLLLYFSVFRVINLIKLIDGRKQIDYLRSAVIRSSLSLVFYQGLVLLITYLANQSGIKYKYKWAVVIGLQLACLFVVAMSLRRSLSKTRPKLNSVFTATDKLPSLSVCIPARNETEDLEECLKCLVASDYPKLEVLVLDDCSQEKRTPEIIRQFAHDGVRFLEGKEPNDSWTAKNYAYQQLYEEASGEVILFCGVDARFETQSLRQMVELKIAKHKAMVSFMPINYIHGGSFRALLVQPMRYLWELGLPRRALNRPPVLSSCWLIDAKTLRTYGSFKAISRSIIPERYFARQTAKKDDGYSFVALGKELGFSSEKAFSSQLDTAIRTRYPILKQRLENVSAITLAELVVFILPIGLFIYELIQMNWLLAIISGLNMMIASISLFVITKLTYGKSIWLSLIAYPVVFGYDVWLCRYSMWQYEFNEVIWKGRNVCIPAMRVESPVSFNEQLKK